MAAVDHHTSGIAVKNEDFLFQFVNSLFDFAIVFVGRSPNKFFIF